MESKAVSCSDRRSQPGIPEGRRSGSERVAARFQLTLAVDITDDRRGGVSESGDGATSASRVQAVVDTIEDGVWIREARRRS